MSLLEQAGAQVLYVPADVSDEHAMREVIAQAVARFGGLNGVIHAAGVSGGGNVRDQSEAQFGQGLAAKVRGPRVLEEVCGSENLDFVCYFSSVSAVLGDFGSCGYAIGNRFQWEHARYRMQQRAGSERCAPTVAVAWPVWAGARDGRGRDGWLAALSEEQRASAPCARGRGLELFERALSAAVQEGRSQMLVLVGEPSRMAALLAPNDLSMRHVSKAREEPALSDPGVPEGMPSLLRRRELQGLSVGQCVRWEVRELASQIMQLPAERMAEDENLAEFGFDSIGLSQLALRLSQHYGLTLSPSMFFTHSTIEQIASHLLSDHGRRMHAFYASNQPPAAAEPSGLSASTGPSGDRSSASPIGSSGEKLRTTSMAPGSLSAVGATSAPAPSASEAVEAASASAPIAIVGMSGRCAQSRTLEEMWSKLAAGEEAVTEIPPERFAWREAYERGEIHGKWLGALPGVEEFDARFFEISPREAEGMDPRQRLLLQEAWRALEEADLRTSVSRPASWLCSSAWSRETISTWWESRARSPAITMRSWPRACRTS